jgi:hypothetical protein
MCPPAIRRSGNSSATHVGGFGSEELLMVNWDAQDVRGDGKAIERLREHKVAKAMQPSLGSSGVAEGVRGKS